MKLIAGVYTRLSIILTRARRAYLVTRATRGWARWLPAWEGTRRVSSVSAAPVLERLGRDVAQAAGGTMFFAHVMLPHHPYVYDANCGVRPLVREWLEALPGGHSAAARAERYPLYLAQVNCVQRKLGALFQRMRGAGVFDDSIIIVHGDHGSRLVRARPLPSSQKAFRSRDYIDAYSTLFAIKLPGQPSRYDDRVLPIDRLLKSVAKRRRIVGGTAWAGPPTVYLLNRFQQMQPHSKMQPHPLPDFADGVPR